MRIGIIGSGHIGGTLAGLLTRAGHEVALANSRGPATLADAVAELGPRARAVTVSEAAAFGDVVVVAIPFGRYADLPPEPLSGRIVVDATNYYPQRDGSIEPLDAGRTTSSELLAGRLPGARLVKAFNTIHFAQLRDDGGSGDISQRRAIFIAGDDPEAKAVVAGLIEEIGFGAVDTGALPEGGARQQPGTAIYNRPITVAEAERELAR